MDQAALHFWARNLMEKVSLRDWLMCVIELTVPKPFPLDYTYKVIVNKLIGW